MKKILFVLGVFIISFGVAICGIANIPMVEIASAEASRYEVNLEHDINVLEVVGYKIILGGVTYEYDKNGYSEGYFKADGIESMEETDFGEGFGLDSNKFLADAGTDVYIKYGFINDTEMFYYVSGIYYSVSGVTYDKVVQPTLNKINGELNFEGTPDGNGFYNYTINDNYKFDIKFENGCLDVVINELYSSIDFRLDHTNKKFNVEFVGTSASVGSANKEEYLPNDVVDIIVDPISNEVIKTVNVYLGETKVITLYGGLYSSGNYLFVGEELYENARISNGNFALGFESDFDYVVDDSGIISKIVFNPEETITFNEQRFEIVVGSDGSVSIVTDNISKNIIVQIETQKFALVNLAFVNDEGDSAPSSIAFSEVVLGGTTYSTPDIPNKIMSLGFTENLSLSLTVKEGYNFHDSVDNALIDGDTYHTNSFAGGMFEVKSEMKDSKNLAVYLYFNNVLFKDSISKIYMSTRADVENKDGFNVDDLMVTSGNGSGVLRNITIGETVKVYVELNQFFMLTINCPAVSDINGKTASTGIYFEVEVENNTVVAVDVDYLYIEKDVFDLVDTDHKIGVIQISRGETSYEVKFKQDGDSEFSFIKKRYPFIQGSDLVNIGLNYQDADADNDVDLLALFGTTFGIKQSEEVYQALSLEIYNNDAKIYAKFESRLATFRYLLNDSNGVEQIHDAYMYYGSDTLYLKQIIQKTDNGLNFGGFWYQNGPNIERVLIDLTKVPETVQLNGETAYAYTLTENHFMDDINFVAMMLSVIEYYTVEFVFDEDYSIKELFYYMDYPEFSVGMDVGGSPLISTPPTIEGEYNLIGWKFETDKDEVVVKLGKDVVATEIQNVYGYSTEFDPCVLAREMEVSDFRFIPVFQAEVFMVTVHRFGGENYNKYIGFGEEVDIEGLFFVAGSWVKEELLGKKFLGFYDSDKAPASPVFEYVDEEVPYVLVENESYFEDIGEGRYSWKLTSNLDLYYWFVDVEYKFNVKLEGEGISKNTLTTNVGEINANGTNTYLLEGFTLNSRLELGGFLAQNMYFVSRVKMDIVPPSGTASEVIFFSASCDKDGVVTEELYELVLDDYNSSEGVLNLMVSRYITNATKDADFTLTFEYKPISYIISFTANFVDKSNNIILNDPSETVYYMVKKVDSVLTVNAGKIDAVRKWIQVDENGERVGATGWKPLVCRSAGIVFNANTLIGISGLNYEKEGVIYSFKMWKDFDKSFELLGDTTIDGSYNFVSVFSDEMDVTLEYYIFDNIKEEYNLHAKKGYFWSYLGVGHYEIDNLVTANSYEIYLLNGNLYYISGWTTEEATDIITGASDIYTLNSVFDGVSYEDSAQTIKLFAVYNVFEFKVSDDGTNYSVDVDVPNDANGNSYSVNDVVWVKVSQDEYNAKSDKLSDIDRAALVLSGVESVANNTVGTGETMAKSVFTTFESTHYLFAIIQRKVDGVVNRMIYVAVKVEV